MPMASQRYLGLRAQTRHHFAVELGMGLPGLACHHPTVPHRLLIGDVLPAARLHVAAAMLVRSDSSTGGEAGARQDLDAVTDPEHPLLALVKLAHDLEHPGVVPQVFRRAAAEHEHRVVVVDANLAEVEV